MIEYKRHRPAFVTGFDAPADGGEVKTVDELLALEWVVEWKDEHQDPRDPDQFQHFCWSDYGTRTGTHLLMVQMKSSHWVIAYLRGDLATLRERLPQWKAKP
jgi:hypothetical protein